MSTKKVIPLQTAWRHLLKSTTLLMLSGAATASSFVLEPNQWNNIVIPADPAGMSVRELFGDDMLNSAGDSLVFGEDWSVFSYDPSLGDYLRPSSEDYAPTAGEGLWIIHVSDVPVTLDIPAVLQAPSPTSLSVGCAGIEGCFDIALPSDSALPSGPAGERFGMFGSPHPYESVLADWRLSTGAPDSECANGCDLDAAAAASFTVPNAFYLQYADDGTRSYATPGIGDVLPPWQGYWFVTRNEAESMQPKLSLPVTPTLSTVAGKVTTPDGLPVSGASVLADSGSDSAVEITALDGSYSLALVADMSYTLSVESEDHTGQVKAIQTPSLNGLINLQLTVIPTQASFSFSNNEVSTSTGSDGAQVNLQPNSFVDTNGQTVTGSVNLTMTSVDVSNAAELAAFPGDFAGRTDQGLDTPIVSLGVTNFAFTSDDGLPVQLADGASATIRIPVYTNTYPDGSSVQVGDLIPLWSLDEETAQWVQEGEGTVVADNNSPTGLVMEATVNHFSWWNCDVTLNAVSVQIQVAGSGTGTALISATAAGDLGWRPNTVDTVVAIGDTTGSLSIPNGVEVCYVANLTYFDGSNATTDRSCLTLTSSPASPIVLTGPGTSSVLALQTSLTPNPVSEVLSVNGFVGGTLERVQISPLSAETQVDYTIIDGTLPAGVELRQVSSTRTEIAGVPTQAGAFSVLVQGINASAENDSVRIDINIQLDAPAPSLPSNIDAEIFGPYEETSVSLEDFNTGGPATLWQLSGPPLPADLSFDELTGEFSVLYDVLEGPPGAADWSGTVTASNNRGSATATVDLTVVVFGGFAFD